MATSDVHPLVPKQHSVLLPHEIFSTVYENSKSKFFKLFCGDNDGSGHNNAHFWSLMYGETSFQDHPFKQVVLDNPNTCVPIRWHADGAKGWNIQSWTPIHNRAFDHRLLYDVHSESDFVEGISDIQSDRALNWSMWWLGFGVHPPRDHLGAAWPIV